MIEKLPFFFESLRSAYQKGLDPIELIEEVYRRITRVNDPGIFINLREKEEVKHEAAKISEKYTAIFLIVVAIFFELVRANQFKKR